jgi:hypothetical protein
MNKGRVGEERRGKEMDRCPLTDMVLGQNGQKVIRYIHRGCGRRSKRKWMVVPLQKHSSLKWVVY